MLNHRVGGVLTITKNRAYGLGMRNALIIVISCRKLPARKVNPIRFTDREL
jgi:hypothetical protein